MSPARSYGVAGGGLTNATWARNAAVAKIGQAGEQRTAVMLDRFARQAGGVTVLHDLRIPIPNITANIDHVVVSGQMVHIIDSKVWKPARYWTFHGKTRRGWSRFEPAEKKTMTLALDGLHAYLSKVGVRASFAVPVLAVWPSSNRSPLHVNWLKVPDARSMTGDQFERYAKRQFAASSRFGIGGGGGKPADPAVVHALASLLTTHRVG